MIDILSEENSSLITWERALIRSGFRFEKQCNGFDLYNETDKNISFLLKIVHMVRENQTHGFDGRIFTPSSSMVDESRWLDAIEQTHSGYESGAFNSENLQIGQLDTYIAGIVRWLNAIGIETIMSCDGDGRPGRRPRVEMRNPDHGALLDYVTRVTTNDKWHYRGDKFHMRGPFNNNQLREEIYERHWLLDVGENLYRCQGPLRELMQLLNTAPIKS